MPGEGRLWRAGWTCGEGTGVETHFFTGIFPSELSCILSFTRLVGRKQPVRPWAGTLSRPPPPKDRQTGTYILSRKVVRGALAVSGCFTRVSISSAQSCRTPEHSSQASDLKGVHATPRPRPDSQEVQAMLGAEPQARCPQRTLPTFSL